MEAKWPSLYLQLLATGLVFSLRRKTPPFGLQNNLILVGKSRDIRAPHSAKLGRLISPLLRCKQYLGLPSPWTRLTEKFIRNTGKYPTPALGLSSPNSHQDCGSVSSTLHVVSPQTLPHPETTQGNFFQLSSHLQPRPPPYVSLCTHLPLGGPQSAG